MIDREKVLTVLRRRFPGAHADALAAAANAIVGLSDEWEDITTLEPDLAEHLTRRCSEGCVVADSAEGEMEFRLYRRRIG
jgi:hypothetical protein